MRLVLFQPDIPRNCGTILRLAACFGVTAEIIEPCGFVLDDRRLRRAGMDYLDRLDLTRHSSWDRFLEHRNRRRAPGRLVLLTTTGSQAYTDYAFNANDSLMLGRESAGVPDVVHAAASARLAIPLRPGLRSLNVAVAAAMVLGEALRQTGGFPPAPEIPPSEGPNA